MSWYKNGEVVEKEIDKIYSFDEAIEYLKKNNLPHSRPFLYKHLQKGSLELNWVGLKAFKDDYLSGKYKSGRPRKY